jgi:hypothetical protein
MRAIVFLFAEYHENIRNFAIYVFDFPLFMGKSCDILFYMKNQYNRD